MATIDYSCFLMVEIVKIFSETLSSKYFQHSKNIVCEIFYKDSLFFSSWSCSILHPSWIALLKIDIFKLAKTVQLNQLIFTLYQHNFNIYSGFSTIWKIYQSLHLKPCRQINWNVWLPFKCVSASQALHPRCCHHMSLYLTLSCRRLWYPIYKKNIFKEHFHISKFNKSQKIYNIVVPKAAMLKFRIELNLQTILRIIQVTFLPKFGS